MARGMKVTQHQQTLKRKTQRSRCKQTWPKNTILINSASRHATMHKCKRKFCRDLLNKFKVKKTSKNPSDAALQERWPERDPHEKCNISRSGHLPNFHHMLSLLRKVAALLYSTPIHSTLRYAQLLFCLSERKFVYRKFPNKTSLIKNEFHRERKGARKRKNMRKWESKSEWKWNILRRYQNWGKALFVQGQGRSCQIFTLLWAPSESTAVPIRMDSLAPARRA